MKENSEVGTNTGIKLKVIGGTGRIVYMFKKSSPLRIDGTDHDEVFIVSPIDFETMDKITITALYVTHCFLYRESHIIKSAHFYFSCL